MKKLDSNEIPWSLGDSGVKYIVQGPDVEWGVLKMKPGQSSKNYGLHIHHVVVESFYIIEGTPKIVVEGVEHRLKPGMTLTVEPHDHHNVVNDTEQDMVALFIKSPYMPEDRHLVEERP
ncbi:MAG: cupin domain-containing protein [Candidatus Hinthialibacter antarcticus]|nr:cupin domain-containing protein [Candidatus Hinthialibacter antarcticus]